MIECAIGKMFALHLEKGHYWIRFFGRGIAVVKDHRLTFSQRMDLNKYYKIGKWTLIPRLTS